MSAGGTPRQILDFVRKRIQQAGPGAVTDVVLLINARQGITGLQPAHDSQSLGVAFDAAATLLAAFFGAWLAFKLSDNARNRERDSRAVDAGNLAMVAIWQRLNALRLYQVDVIDPVRVHPGRWIKLRPTPAEQERIIPLEASALGYLLDGKHHEVMTDVLLADSKYRQAVQVMEIRSRFHLDVVQPKLAMAGIKSGVPHDPKVFLDALGEFESGHLQSLTDSLIWCVDDAVKALLAVGARLRDATRARYPKHYVIDLELVEPPPRTAPS